MWHFCLSISLFSHINASCIVSVLMFSLLLVRHMHTIPNRMKNLSHVHISVSVQRWNDVLGQQGIAE